MKKIDNLEVPTTITELRDDLLTTYAEIGAGRIKLPLAKEKANTAGKWVRRQEIGKDFAVRVEVEELP